MAAQMKSDSLKSFELIFSFATLIGLEYTYIIDYAIACNNRDRTAKS